MTGFTDDRDRLPMWVLYDHPLDHPEHYVARKFLTLPRATPTGEAIADTDADALRRLFERAGLTRLFRDNSDDPVIMETWL